MVSFRVLVGEGEEVVCPFFLTFPTTLVPDDLLDLSAMLPEGGLQALALVQVPEAARVEGGGGSVASALQDLHGVEIPGMDILT